MIQSLTSCEFDKFKSRDYSHNDKKPLRRLPSGLSVPPLLPLCHYNQCQKTECNFVYHVNDEDNANIEEKEENEAILNIPGILFHTSFECTLFHLFIYTKFTTKNSKKIDENSSRSRVLRLQVLETEF